jgi:hypothetical protein
MPHNYSQLRHLTKVEHISTLITLREANDPLARATKDQRNLMHLVWYLWPARTSASVSLAKQGLPSGLDRGMVPSIVILRWRLRRESIFLWRELVLYIVLYVYPGFHGIILPRKGLTMAAKCASKLMSAARLTARNSCAFPGTWQSPRHDHPLIREACTVPQMTASSAATAQASSV